MKVPEWRKELRDEEIYAEDEESIIL